MGSAEPRSRKMRPDLAGIASAAFEVSKSMDGIGRAGSNFNAIESGVAKATGYFKILQQAMTEAEKAGIEIGRSSRHRWR